jgi:RHS repeat-associated protein
VVDDSATVKTNYTFTAYGETTNSGNEVYPYGFTGRRYIEIPKLYDYRTRAYDPKMGRFLERDAIDLIRRITEWYTYALS